MLRQVKLSILLSKSSEFDFLGDLWQLPPIFDSLVTDKSCLDGRPDFAPSYWKEYFKIYYLTEKMRSQEDPYFSDVCDRVKVGKLLEDDVQFLNSRVMPCPSELINENFKCGKLSIIVTTNAKKDLINHKKLEQLLPHEKEFICNSTDHAVNLPLRDKLPETFKNNPAKTGNLHTQLRLKIGAPIVVTVNHAKQKYREDGLVNGARGYVHAIQTSKTDPEIVDVVWVVFNDENVGRLYRAEHRHLLKGFNPKHKLATPILPIRRKFKDKFGNVEYQRQNFSLSLAYCITAHKCQGWTLD